VRVSELPLVAPEVKLSAVGVEKVKVGAVRVATTVAVALAAMVAPVVVPEAEMVAVRVPEVAAVDVTVTVLVAVPPDVRVTEVGETAQEPAALPVVFAAAQVRATGPAKPLMEVRVTVLVPLVPEIRLRVVGDADMVKDEATRVTVTADEVTMVDPLVPVTVTWRTPEVPGVVRIVRVGVAELPEVRISDAGRMVQVPAAVPLMFVTVQVRATVPAKLLVEATVTTSVLPVTAPEMRL